MPSNSTSSAPSTPGFEVVDTLKNAEGIVIVITKKSATGGLSLALFKEFERNGHTERTSFFQRRQIDQVIELLKIAGEKIDQAIDREKAAERELAEQRVAARRRANSRGQ